MAGTDADARDPAPAPAAGTTAERSGSGPRASLPNAERPAALPTHPTRREPAGASAENDELRRRLLWLNGARFGVAGLLYGFAHTVSGGVPRPSIDLVRWIAVASVASAGAHAVALRAGRSLRVVAAVQIAVDLLAWTALVYATGGPASPMVVFYALSALTAALVLDERAAALTAMAGTTLYALMSVGVASGWVRLLPDYLKYNPPTPADQTLYPVVNVIAVLLVSVLAGNLANRVTRVGGALARAEATRADLAALYEDVLRSIPVALLTCRIDGTVDGANPVAARLFDTTAEALLGTDVRAWLPSLPVDAFAQDGPTLTGDAVLERGARRVVTYTAAPLYEREGRARGGLVVIEDRTAQETTREELQRAERLAVLGRLAAALAHEIRNPLGAISGCVSLVHEGDGISTEDRELLGTVQREAARLNALVTDMLSFAKPRPPVRDEVPLRALAREVATLASAQSQGAPVTVAGDGDDVRVWADAAQLRQLLWNLVRNAVQVAPAGSTVEVRVEPREAPPGATLVVADRGPGVPEALRDRIFDVFYSGRSQGTGLGLAIVRQVAEAHGGAVSVRPRAGGGSEFVVTLPRGRDRAGDEA